MKIKGDQNKMPEGVVLVVEDEVSLQEAIQLQFKKEKVKTLQASTAEEALVLLGKERPALIWLDLLMPGMGGFALLEKLRSDDKFSDLPVVIVSVSAGPDKIRRAFELNVVDYLVKSQYKVADLVGKVINLLKDIQSSSQPK